MKSALRLALIALVAATAFVLWRRGEGAPNGDGASSRAKTGAADSRRAPPSDPDAENPDPVRVDHADRPFDPSMVGGTFRLAQTPPRSLNALTNESAEAARFRKYFLGAPLLMEAPDRVRGAFVALPYAAVSMPEESEDGLTHLWTLRGDVTWEDGRPVLAEDYVFTFKMLREIEPAPRQRDAFKDVEDVVALDARKLRVTWRRAYFRAAISFGLDLHVAPSHAVPREPAAFAALTSHLSCGPYKIAVFKPQESLEVVLRDEYRAKPFPLRPHYVERFTVVPAADVVGRYARFLSGEFDLVQLDFDRFARAGDDAAFRAVAWRAPIRVPSFSAVFWNHRDPSDPSRARPHPLFGDARVRVAMDRLFDRESTARHAFHGAASPTSGPFVPGGDDSDASVKPRAFDPEAAAAGFKEAGFERGLDGILAKDGIRASFALGYPTLPAAVYSVVPAMLQEAARTIGVEVRLAPRPATDFFDAGEKRAEDALLAIWFTDFIEPDIADTFRSDGALTGGVNWAACADDALDGLFDAMGAERSPTRRSEIRRRVHRRLHEIAPCSFLFTSAAPVALSRRFANVEIHDLGFRYWDLVERARLPARGLGR